MVMIVRTFVIVTFIVLVAATTISLSQPVVAVATAASLFLAVYLLLHAWDFRRVLLRASPSQSSSDGSAATIGDLILYVVLYPIYRVGIAFGFVVLLLFYVDKLMPGLVVQGSRADTGLWQFALFALQHVATQLSAGLIIPHWTPIKFHDSGLGYYLGWFVVMGGFSTCVALLVTWLMALTVRRGSELEPATGWLHVPVGVLVEPYRGDAIARPASHRPSDD